MEKTFEMINKVFVAKGIKKTKKNNSLILENNTKTKKKAVFPSPIKMMDGSNSIEFKIEKNNGNSIELKVLNKKMRVVETIMPNTKVYLNNSLKTFFLGFTLLPGQKVEIKSILVKNEENTEFLIEHLKGEKLLITSVYPSDNDKYSAAFIHSRMREFRKQGLDVDLVVLNNKYIDKTVSYEYEGVKVINTGYNDLRKVLQVKHYETIMVHFFDQRIAQILDATNIKESKIYIYAHGADVLFNDWDEYNMPYFETTIDIPEEVEKSKYWRNAALMRYNEMKNVKFVFVSNWLKDYAEKSLEFKFNNSEIIPCFIDEKTFEYKKPNKNNRKKIFLLRPFNNLKSYSIDIAVKIILELSKREFFNDLEFSIYGDGEMHYKLLEPISKFKNVNINKEFLSHDEISKIHQTHGIALFPSRFDTQSVSAGEAAMSGCVVLTSYGVAIEEFIDPSIGTFSETENYKEYADLIEKYYKDADLFLEDSKKMHESSMNTGSSKVTIEKEINMLKTDSSLKTDGYKYKKQVTNPIITIAIPSYNAEKYLEKGVYSLIDHKLSNKIEVLIINDGSKDNTGKIGKKLEELTTVSGSSIVKIINKENGGHGSTINKAIEIATGKYFKLMDGDDFFITSEFEKLVKLLEKETSDIILTNYVEDFAIDGVKHIKKLYEFLPPFIEHNLEDLYYDGYGFTEWGPLLSTSTYKTQMLKDANFKLDEHCFYVDMELNLISYMKANTVKYYPLDIYNYYLGREGQSVSPESFKKNYLHHEKVTLRLLKEIKENRDGLTENKIKYLENIIIVPMVKMQYSIITDYIKSGKEFMKFDRKTKDYEYYNDPRIITKKYKFHRFTKGTLIRYDKILTKVSQIFRGGK